MKKCSVLIGAAVLAVMLTGPAFLSVSAGTGNEAEKVLQAPPPVCFELRLPLTVKQKLSQKILSDTKMLVGLMDELRKMPLDSDENITKAAQKLKEIYKGTYLNRPRLIMDDAKLPYDGWKAVIGALKGLVKEGAGIQIQDVAVQVFYVPYAAAKDAELDTDMKMQIRTTVIIGTRNDILEGWLLHRRTCTPLAYEE